MSDKQKIKELEAMLVHLSKRIEKLEGTSRMAPPTSYLSDLRSEASDLLDFWH